MKKGTRKIHTGKSPYGVVSTASKYATKAGMAVLENGGNAVDAAAACAICLGVSEPQASGIGGQSMAILYLKDQDRLFSLDGSSRAPYNIQPDNLPAKPIKVGIRSTTVPSTVATVGYMHENYGKLPLKEVLQPSIDVANNGFRVSALIHNLLKQEEERLRYDPGVYKNFFVDGKVADAGHIIKQPELAETLQTLADYGWEEFYTGSIAQRIVEDMEERNGLITLADLAQIPYPLERDVLETTYRGRRVATFPPPGAGRVLIQLLNILERFDSSVLDPEDEIGALIFALAFRFALTDRKKLPIHPNYYLQSMNQLMIDKGYAKEIAEKIYNIGKFYMGDGFTAPPHSGETTHLSVIDKDGNAVGITQSIELVFGSKTIAKGLGFFYNNYMSAYDYKDMTHPFYLVPGAKPFSSVAPTIIFNGDQVEYLLGSPGSERISTSVVQVISRLIDKKMPLDQAIAAPRFHSSHYGVLQIEKERFNQQVIDNLERTGFDIRKRGRYSFYLGCVQGVKAPVNDEDPFYYGAADPRRDGSAGGPEQIKRRENDQ